MDIVEFPEQSLVIAKDQTQYRLKRMAKSL